MPKTSLALPSEAEQQKLGAHLTSQYRLAVGGMLEHIAFGALVENVQRVVSALRTQSGRGGGPDTKGDGLKGWLDRFAPEVSRPTAYRCMELAESIRAEFKIGERADLHHLLKGSKASPAELLKRKAITAFVEGKSQRQLLIGIGKPDAEVGGKRTKTKKLTPAEEQAEWIAAATQTAKSTANALRTIEERWKLLDDIELKLAVEAAEKFAEEARTWLKTPPPSRAALDAAKYLAAEEEKAS